MLEKTYSIFHRKFQVKLPGISGVITLLPVGVFAFHCKPQDGTFVQYQSVLSCFPTRMEMVGSTGSAGTYFKTVQSSKNWNILFCSVPSDGTFPAAFGFSV